MWTLGPGFRDEAALAHAWRAASPFAHLVFDDLLAPEELSEVLAVVDEEVVRDYAADIYALRGDRARADERGVPRAP